MYTKHVPHSRQWGYSRAQVRRCLYPVKQHTFKYKDTDSKYMHERDSVKSVINEMGTTRG